jgi:ATP/maltotriose-dependent transcriptional regulator MalT
MGTDETDRDALALGWEALRKGNWAQALELLEEALARSETPEAWEGMGWAGYFLDDSALTFEARERAYRGYRERGDDASAGRVASWLAADSVEFRGEPAVASGWLQRAHSLLDPVTPGPDHGWLAIHEASMILDSDTVTARRLARSAVELGRRFGVAELEAVGLGIEGQALVSEGHLDEGMRRLDEATATALAGEAESLICIAWAGCYVIAACEQVRDYERAGQWSQRIAEFCQRHGIGILLGVCRAKYAAVLAWQGRWAEAEVELNAATETLAASRPGLTREALVRLAELRRWQGRLDEAVQLYDRCQGSLRALLGRAWIALERDRAEEALDLGDRFLRRLEPGRIERTMGLEVTLRAQAQLGEFERAHRTLEEFRALAQQIKTTALLAAAATLEGVLAAASNENDRARRCFEDALDLLSTGGAPYEAAKVRLELAATLRSLGRTGMARQELEAAIAAFEELGAGKELSQARELLERVAPKRDHDQSDGPFARLSKREVEVLSLVAQGLTNADIAQRLFVSEHTVHRHVANILRKLGVQSRTAAASTAGRFGLLQPDGPFPSGSG